jgi:ribosomal protein L33
MGTNSWTSTLPNSADATQPITTLECEKCQSMGFSYLSYAEAEAVLCNGTVSRYCRVCNKQTMWRRLEPAQRKSNFHAA